MTLSIGSQALATGSVVRSTYGTISDSKRPDLSSLVQLQGAVTTRKYRKLGAAALVFVLGAALSFIPGAMVSALPPLVVGFAGSFGLALSALIDQRKADDAEREIKRLQMNIQI